MKGPGFYVRLSERESRFMKILLYAFPSYATTTDFLALAPSARGSISKQGVRVFLFRMRRKLSTTPLSIVGGYNRGYLLKLDPAVFGDPLND